MAFWAKKTVPLHKLNRGPYAYLSLRKRFVENHKTQRF